MTNYVEEKDRLEAQKQSLWRAMFKSDHNRGLKRRLNFVYSQLEKIQKLTGYRSYDNLKS